MSDALFADVPGYGDGYLPDGSQENPAIVTVGPKNSIMGLVGRPQSTGHSYYSYANGIKNKEEREAKLRAFNAFWMALNAPYKETYRAGIKWPRKEGDQCHTDS